LEKDEWEKKKGKPFTEEAKRADKKTKIADQSVRRRKKE